LLVLLKLFVALVKLLLFIGAVLVEVALEELVELLVLAGGVGSIFVVLTVGLAGGDGL